MAYLEDVKKGSVVSRTATVTDKINDNGNIKVKFANGAVEYWYPDADVVVIKNPVIEVGDYVSRGSYTGEVIYIDPDTGKIVTRMTHRYGNSIDPLITHIPRTNSISSTNI